jgi:hypothetical protein
VCDAPQTGTMLKRCQPAEVKTISREDIDRGAADVPHGPSGLGATR